MLYATANGERVSDVAYRRQRRSANVLWPHLFAPARGIRVSSVDKMIT